MPSYDEYGHYEFKYSTSGRSWTDEYGLLWVDGRCMQIRRYEDLDYLEKWVLIAQDHFGDPRTKIASRWWGEAVVTGVAPPFPEKKAPSLYYEFMKIKHILKKL